jgi:putative acetyltransferase
MSKANHLPQNLETQPAILIREEQAGDVDAIREVNRKAFGRDQEAGIVDNLRHNCPTRLSLVAVKDGQIVGHIYFSPAWIVGQSMTIEGMGLAPMAVTPECQRQGIGSLLVQAGLEKLQERGSPFVLVLGHPDYYPRFGFEPASRHGVRCPWQVPDEAFLICVFDSFAVQGVTGTAKYRDEFADAI